MMGSLSKETHMLVLKGKFEEILCNAILVCLGCHDKHYRLGDLNNRNLLSRSSGGWKPKTRVLAELGPSKAPREDSVHLLGLYMAIFPLCLHVVFALLCLGPNFLF